MQKKIVNNEENDENEDFKPEQGNNSSDFGIVATKNAEHNIHVLTVIGQVVIIDRVKHSTQFPYRSPF